MIINQRRKDWRKLFLFRERDMYRITSNIIELHAGENVIFEHAYNETENPRDVSKIEETVTKRSSSQEK